MHEFIAKHENHIGLQKAQAVRLTRLQQSREHISREHEYELSRFCISQRRARKEPRNFRKELLRHYSFAKEHVCLLRS